MLELRKPLQADISNQMKNTLAIDDSARQILTFWFGADEDHGNSRQQWFRKDAAFDDEIHARFVAIYAQAAAGKLAHWQEQPLDCLALIILLDQFPRNMFRGTGRAFESDSLARDAARHALAQGYDRNMLPVERQFVYLPLEHSELLAEQEQCLTLMKELSAFPDTHDLHVWSEKHLVIIRRFGRFPHRNRLLGRESTAEEIEFLRQPGSGF